MLFIGTALYENKVHVPYMHGMLQTMSVLQSHGLPMQYAMEQGTYIAVNRERLVRKFLDTNCQFFLFIDSDMAFGPQDVLALLSADVDVVSGFYRSRTPIVKGVVNHCFRDLNGNPVKLNVSELQECELVPTGILMIRRSVFEKLYQTHKYIFNQGFLGEEKGDNEWERLRSAFEGEDAHFSRLWREAGGKLYVKTDILVGHVGEYQYNPIQLGEATYL